MQVFLIVVAVVLVIGIFWFIGTKNSFNRMLIKIDEAESGIDVALTKRFDMLTKLVDATRGFMKHEKDTFEAIVKMRQPGRSASIEEKAQFTEEVNTAMRSINVAVEAYPELKSNDAVQKLQSGAMEVEAHLQAARRLYNSNVSIYNQSIVVFPASIVAGTTFTKRNFFEAEASKREDVKIEL